MDTAEIISQIDAQIMRLQSVRALLTEAPLKKGPDRPKTTEPPVARKPKKRRLSAKGRAAISAAMKARWAKRRKAD
jgi:hypothetical protein